MYANAHIYTSGLILIENATAAKDLPKPLAAATIVRKHNNL